MKLDLLHCNRVLAALEEDAIRRDVPVKRCTYIQDIKGFGWDQCKYSAASTLVKLTESRSLLLPEVIGKILMINAPPPFAMAWSMFKNLLHPNTQAKVQVAKESESLALLRRYLPHE